MVDPARGMARIDRNKTGDRWPIALDAGTLAAMKAWKSITPKGEPQTASSSRPTASPS
jgi:hypothetical protein